MKQFNGPIGFLQGSKVLFSDFADGGQMWAGEGNREARHEVRFGQAFAATPVVMVGLSMWDMDSATNQRVDISTEAVTASGFCIVFRTWGDSRIARVRADWTAIGQMDDDEGCWEV